VTAGPHVRRHRGRFDRSVRGSRLPRPGRIGWALVGLVLVAVAVDGVRGLLPAFPRGDLLYHWGLAHGILLGEIPPGGPYQGLPAYYPPGFHLLIAALSAVASTTVETATLLLGFAWLPVLPLGTFALARYISGRGDIALVAAALTVFGGAYDVGGDRIWVNSLFLSGHQFYPLFPRDLVFGLLPLAVLAFLRALDADRAWTWAVAAGGLLGACAVIQVQLLLPIPIALLVAAVAAAAADPARRRRAVVALVVTGGLATLAIAPWLIETVATIRRNGGVALDSADTLLPARIGLWDYPREFGLFLPLALVGAALVLIHARDRDPAVSGLSPHRQNVGIVLVPWFALPWLMAVFYDPGWPLEDALRPQRLWLLSSQPAAILASIGLVALARDVVGRRWHRPRWIAPVIVAVVLAAAVPTVTFTLRQLFQTWIEPAYAHLELDRDRVPDMASILATRTTPSTVLAYEDWSSLVWYETGNWVVAVKPPGYAKLAFDPLVFTGHGQDARRADLTRAFRGDPAELTAVADAYGADRILIARRDDRWGVIQQVAALAARVPGALTEPSTVVDGNGWDDVDLAPGAGLTFDLAATDRPMHLEMRFVGEVGNKGAPARRVRLVAAGIGQSRDVIDLVLPATAVDEWQVIGADIELRTGERLVVQAIDEVALQSFVGFVATTVPPGWQTVTMTPDAVVLGRVR
jgi:hypothetical protein